MNGGIGTSSLNEPGSEMRPIKAVYEDGHLMFPEGAAPEGRMEVVVIFPDQSEPSPPRDKDGGKRFDREWAGVLKGCDISNWKDEKAEYLKGRPSENPA
jgi:hypothetical protein